MNNNYESLNLNLLEKKKKKFNLYYIIIIISNITIFISQIFICFYFYKINYAINELNLNQNNTTEYIQKIEKITNYICDNFVKC